MKELKKSAAKISKERERKRKWLAEHREWIRAYQRKWQKEKLLKDPEFRKKRNHISKLIKYRRRSKTIGTHSVIEWEELKKKYSHCCLGCGRQEPFTDLNYKFLTEDHVKPISKGGMNTIENIQPLCIDCNCRKAEKEIDFRHRPE